MNNFGLILSKPISGWLPVEIIIGGKTCNFSSSDVLNDPINELADAVLNILSYLDSSIVRWWLEPDWHTLMLKPKPDSQCIEITLYCHHNRENFASAHNTYRILAPKLKVCRCIASSLRTLMIDSGSCYFENPQTWKYGFPDRKIERIYSKIRAMKNT